LQKLITHITRRRVRGNKDDINKEAAHAMKSVGGFFILKSKPNNALLDDKR